MDRLSFSAQRKKDSRKLSFFCAFRGRVRDHIDNPSKPPFKFTSLLFVATARKNKFICSSLALIATLIREALLGAENEFRHRQQSRYVVHRFRHSLFVEYGTSYQSHQNNPARHSLSRMDRYRSCRHGNYRHLDFQGADIVLAIVLRVYPHRIGYRS